MSGQKNTAGQGERAATLTVIIAVPSVFAAYTFGLPAAIAVAGSAATVAWMVAVVNILLQIRDRLPSPLPSTMEKSSLKKDFPAAEKPDAPGQTFTASIYEVKRDGHGRILAD